ncbi:MAG TPA: CU044_5270 family protein [Trebonia sp.]|nr:CU044_5270 family protein [Trebonia sp.]
MTSTSEPPLAHFEERLLLELKAEVAARNPGIQTAGTRAAKARPARRRPVMIGAAAGVSAAVAAGLLVATARTPVPTKTAGYSLAADFLNRAASAARVQDASLPKPDQVSYEEEFVAAPGGAGGYRRCFVNWSPQPLTGLGGGTVGLTCGRGVPAVPPGLKALRSSALAQPQYQYPALNTLPASPAALRAALYAAAARGGAVWGLPTADSADVIVAFLISRIMEAPLSGPVRAALYELLARTPGVTLVRNAVDADGRHGTGILWKWDYPEYGPGTIEVIFNPRTYTVLGGNNVMPGQPSSFAIMGSGLVTLPWS